MSDSEDSDRDSLDSIAPYENKSLPEDPAEQEKVMNVREAVRAWKARELPKMANSEPRGLGFLLKYKANSARLYNDLNTYLNTSQNNEKNMADSLYRSIVTAIGAPGSLPFHTRILLESLLERDLLELPFTVKPSVVNTYAKKGMRVETEFPDEE
jgi:hypothetical protein